jgi:Zn-dependent M28 family amino/carboxypeptidase
MLEADIVWFDSHTDYQRSDLSFLKGKAVIHLGCHIETAAYYQALMQAEPAFLIFVDTRFTGDLPLADGLFPAYVRQYGAKPTVDVAYFDAWQWKKEKASKARLCISGTFKNSMSENMIAEIPGTAPELGCVYAGGHHDTQAGTVGADDNASGTAAMIELARMLSAKPHLRTIRLISFGAEEQLSMGSAAYVRRHRDEVAKSGVFMANFDTYGSLMGWNCLQSIGTDKQLKLIKDIFRNHDMMLEIETEVSPYVDNFPFNAAGVPSFWAYRKNCICGHYYHHRADATPDKLDFDICADIVRAGADVISFFADTPDLSEYNTFTETQRARIEAYWNSVYGGWDL